jgi:hypothetical protein
MKGLVTKTTTIICYWCGCSKDIPTKEYTRQVKNGATRFFCSCSHAVQYGNSLRFAPVEPIIVECEYCHKPFKTVTGRDRRRFDSTSCAAKGTVTEARRAAGRRAGAQNKHNLLHLVEVTAVGLKKREAYKYESLADQLAERSIPYEFEAVIGNRIFDLVLPDHRICIEFDGPDHKSINGRNDDNEKTTIATNSGYHVIRIPTGTKEIIDPPSCISILEGHDVDLSPRDSLANLIDPWLTNQMNKNNRP